MHVWECMNAKPWADASCPVTTKKAELGLGEEAGGPLWARLQPARGVAERASNPRWTELLRNEVSALALNPLVTPCS